MVQHATLYYNQQGADEFLDVTPEFWATYQLLPHARTAQQALTQGRGRSCPTSPTLCTFNNSKKQFFHPFKMLWKSESRSPFSSFTELFLGW
jgi:hypothetical protein